MRELTARHRRLSRRMAARPAALAAELRGMVGRNHPAVAAGRPRASRRPPGIADLAALDPNAPADETLAQTAARHFTDYLRACRDERFALSLLPPGRFLMPGELADSPGADLRAARPAGGHSARRLALGDDAAALQVLQGRHRAAVLPRSHRAARPPDRAGRCADRAQCRTGRGPRSRTRARRHPRQLQYRPQLHHLRAVRAAHRPHPVRRHQGRSPAPHLA